MKSFKKFALSPNGDPSGRSRKGFTLVELLIVILIIGILATIAIISYAGASARARQGATITALNDSIKGAAVCVAGGSTIRDWASGPTGVQASYDQNVCTDSALTSAKWPKVRTLNKYTVNLPTIGSDNSVTYDSTITNTDSSYDITCTVSGCTK